MVNSTSMSSERAIPDLWDVFGSRGGNGLAIRRNSWQKMQKQLSEDERAVTELFHDLHLHDDPSDSQQSQSPTKQNNDSHHNQRNNKSSSSSNQQQQSKDNNWEHIEKHLSMKKTIRKKMMRDLQQAFIDGQEPPTDVSHDRWEVQLEAHKAGVEPNLLDMLKEKDTPVTNNNPTPPKKPGFWKKLTMRKSSSSGSKR